MIIPKSYMISDVYARLLRYVPPVPISSNIYETPDNQMFFNAKQELFLKHPEHNTLKISKGNYIIIHEREFNPFKNIEEPVFD